MCKTALYSILVISAVSSGFAQQTDPNNKPNVFLDNKGKPPKSSNARTIDGIVKDAADNPVRGAIVQLKDMKTSKVVDFPTKDDGKFMFRDLSMDIDYELTAKHDGMTSMKKVSPFDTRKEVILTFRLEPPEKKN
ncbi:MAG TPA: carboxypeptidase-like regulatory domain-containing protein [Bryobacteraceae bacterium]|nr:carboxypeptidase-like regulatory domain-containing protein [Bryobacteraceae bacterium]